AEPRRPQADMVMAVDEARQQDLLARADHRHGRVLAVQVVVGADRDDDAVLLQHGAILDLVPGETILHPGDSGAATDEGGRHLALLSFRLPRLTGEVPRTGRRGKASKAIPEHDRS